MKRKPVYPARIRTAGRFRRFLIRRAVTDEARKEARTMPPDHLNVMLREVRQSYDEMRPSI